MPLTKPTFGVANIQGLSTLVQDQEATLKVLFDKTGEDAKAYLIALCDQIDLDIATKSELAGIVLGDVTDGSLTDVKLSDVAGQIKDRLATHLLAYAEFVATKAQASGLASLDSGGILVQKPYVSGTYTGDGVASRFIDLGFTPGAVFVANKEGQVGDGSTVLYGGLALSGVDVVSSTGVNVLQIVTNGFNVAMIGEALSNYAEASVNPYRYIAYR